MNGETIRIFLETRHCMLQMEKKPSRSQAILLMILLPILDSDHEEADTRMLLHANHASHDYQSIVISTPDTDVFMITLSASTRISSSLYIMTGTKDRRRLIDMTAVTEYAYNTF